MASKNYYLVDTENVGSSWKYLLADKNARDEIIIFYTDKSPYISYADMCEIIKYPNSFKMIKCYTGRDALDFQLDSYLGFLLRSTPKAHFYIISNDNGYEAICRFWGDQGYSVFRKTAATLIAEKTGCEDNSCGTPDSTASISFDSNDSDEITQESPTPITDSGESTNSISPDSFDNGDVTTRLESPDKEVLSEITEKKEQPDSKVTPKKSSDRSTQRSKRKNNDSGNNHNPRKVNQTPTSIPSAVTIYIPEQYRGEYGLENKIMVIIENSDINRLQPLYNTFIKQFGQVKGLDLYKSIKSHLKDIKKEITATKKS